MSSTITPNLAQYISSPFARRSYRVLFILWLALLFSTYSFGQAPTYTYEDGMDLEFINVQFTDIFDLDAKLNKVILAVDTNNEGEVFVLTFGNGIKRVDATGGLIDFIPNEDNRLSSPMDFAINSDGKFYVATNESNRRFIRVYSSTGAYLSSELLGDGTYGTGSNQFKGPVGLTFDKDDNLYVADHYIGDEQNVPEPSRIKIFFKDVNGSYKDNLLTQFDKVEGVPLNFPYRLAVDSSKNIYIAELGSGNGRVQVVKLDVDNNPFKIDEIAGNIDEIGSPGSIVIDNYDNIFISDFGDKVNITTILEAANNPEELLDVFDDVKEGIEDDVFKINVYNSNRTYLDKISLKIDWAIDMAIDPCGKLYVNDAIVSGTKGRAPFYFNMNANFNFYLEVYKRSPGYDSVKPVLVTFPEDITIPNDEGENYAVVSYAEPTFTDSGPVTLTITDGYASGSQFPIGTTTVKFKATDICGNSSFYEFEVTVEENTLDTEAPVISCPANITQNIDGDKCSAIVTFADATATDNSGSVTVTQTAGLTSGSEFPVGTSTVTFQAEDEAGLKAECSFTVTIIDNEVPLIICPSNISETVDFGEPGKVVTFAAPSVSDNCSGTTLQQTAGLSSGSEFPIGVTTNTFKVTDAAGLVAECSFTVEVKEGADTEAPVISCPANITQNIDGDKCSAIVTFADATATDNSGSVTVTQTAGLTSGSEFPVGTSTVTFQAEDDLGNTENCSFSITIVDNITPTFECPDNITAGFEITQGYTVPDFSSFLPASDNCDTNLRYTQSPAPDSIITAEGDYPVVLTATDAGGNTASCSFMVVLQEEPQENVPPVTNADAYNTFKEETLSVDAPGVLANDTDANGDAFTAVIQRTTINGNLIFYPDGGFVYIPDTGFTGVDSFTYTATDGISGTSNVATVTINVLDPSNENVAPVSVDDAFQITQNQTLNVSAPGVLANDTDANGDTLTSFARSATGNGSFSFNTDGSFTYTPNAGFVGTDSFTYVANDGNLDSEIATVVIEVITQSTTNVVCKDAIQLELDESGNASLNAEELFTEKPDDLQYTVSRSNFTCNDLGGTTVTLSYSNASVQGSCEVEVSVVDTLAPTILSKEISVELDEFGTVNITPEMLDNGTLDNCGDVTLSLDKTSFSCKELGENIVLLTAVDASGNSASVQVKVEVAGDCGVTGEPEIPYIFIYPNPTDGRFSYSVSDGVIIEKVEVYDFRGRYIQTKTYPANFFEYKMDLSDLQQAVYVLHVYTNIGNKILRVIIR
ncbi:HYR domain-containing protein [Gillisia sp. M10.2A]|uniref:HYR domain-containing protein n=1 Tax=Gillisia lutea TaxID=2909668 RepID=A0ABS9EF92_9FLAO|nr:HYR domain-containing protein [Gillisia lutea]MCF4100942.1 HYR domain-containing protein [Gillisia lutea]